MSVKKSYHELVLIPSFIDRYEYLKLSAEVGDPRFGFDRYLNQAFYNSREWRNFRNHIISRDDGCDLAHRDYPIDSKAIIHHINPLTVDDFEKSSDALFDPDNVILVCNNTHQAIHYGTEELLPKSLIIRRPNDTIPWK